MRPAGRVFETPGLHLALSQPHLHTLTHAGANYDPWGLFTAMSICTVPGFLK